jgi:hypothetical protein
MSHRRALHQSACKLRRPPERERTFVGFRRVNNTTAKQQQQKIDLLFVANKLLGSTSPTDNNRYCYYCYTLLLIELVCNYHTTGSFYNNNITGSLLEHTDHRFSAIKSDSVA